MRLRLATAAAALVLAGSGALAFQEQSVGGAAAPGAAPKAAVNDQAPTAAPAAAPTGTEIRIPGLGKLGVIPKMDFGLELLYGAADQGASRKIEEKSTGDEGQVMIRGTIRRNF
jgi:hypothetical protein